MGIEFFVSPSQTVCPYSFTLVHISFCAVGLLGTYPISFIWDAILLPERCWFNSQMRWEVFNNAILSLLCCFCFLFFKVPRNKSHYHIRLVLYTVKCRSVCNSRGCSNSELQMEGTYAQGCFQKCKYAKICNHRWKKKSPHRNMYKCCTCQGRCTEKSDSILQGCKVCMELRQCRCLFKKVPRV